jgi:WD40 repeat protein
MTLLVSGCGTNTVPRPSDSRLLQYIAWSNSDPSAVSWSPDSTKIAVGSGSGPAIRIFSAENGKQLSSFGDYPIGSNGLAWSPDGKFLAGVLRNPQYSLQVWDTNNNNASVLLINGGSGGIHLSWSHDSRFLAVGAEGKRTSQSPEPNGGISIYQAPTWTEVLTTSLSAIVVGPSWSLDDSRLAYADNAAVSDLTHLAIFDVSGTKVEQLGEEQEGFATQIAWAPKGELIALAVNTLQPRPAKVVIINAATRNIIQTIPVSGTVTALSWSPSGERIGITSSSAEMKVWDTNAGAIVETYYHDSETASPLVDVAWAPNGEQIATLATDHTLWLWRAPK